MNTELFVKRVPFDDLEIHTLDGPIYYTTKSWLYSLSDYFKIMLTSGFSEKNSNVIKLNHNSKILLVLFKCIYYGYKGDVCLKNFMVKLESIDDICEFFYMCNEYHIDSLKSLCEIYCSENDNRLKSLISAELISLVELFNLSHLDYKIRCIMTEEMVKSIKFENMKCETLNFFICAGKFIQALMLWLQCHDPSDKELFDAKLHEYAYNNLSEKECKKFICVIRNIKNAKEFKLIVLEKLSYIFCYQYSYEDFEKMK